MWLWLRIKEMVAADFKALYTRPDFEAILRAVLYIALIVALAKFFLPPDFQIRDQPERKVPENRSRII